MSETHTETISLRLNDRGLHCQSAATHAKAFASSSTQSIQLELLSIDYSMPLKGGRPVLPQFKLHIRFPSLARLNLGDLCGPMQTSAW